MRQSAPPPDAPLMHSLPLGFSEQRIPGEQIVVAHVDEPLHCIPFAVFMHREPGGHLELINIKIHFS